MFLRHFLYPKIAKIISMTWFQGSKEKCREKYVYILVKFDKPEFPFLFDYLLGIWLRQINVHIQVSIFLMLKNLMGMKSLPCVNIKRFYEMCIVNAKHIPMPALMRVSPSLIRIKLLEASMGFDWGQLIDNTAVWGVLSSYVPGARDVSRNVGKMSKTSPSTCNEVLKNAFVMSLLSFLLHSIHQTFIECLHHSYSFPSLAELLLHFDVRSETGVLSLTFWWH